ncbi:MAG: Zn-ribbon domain-containing OB-fold protein [Microthrixaceae bacterium]
MSAAEGRPVPVPTPETQHFWDGTKAGKLLLQRCERCEHVYFPPRPFCPACSCREVAVVESSGRGVLWSYVISHRPHPAFEGPYAIAVVRLDDGPQMMTNIVGCEPTPEALVLDMVVRVRFEPLTDDITLPLFEPETTVRTPLEVAS